MEKENREKRMGKREYRNENRDTEKRSREKWYWKRNRENGIENQGNMEKGVGKVNQVKNVSKNIIIKTFSRFSKYCTYRLRVKFYH